MTKQDLELARTLRTQAEKLDNEFFGLNPLDQRLVLALIAKQLRVLAEMFEMQDA